MKLPHFALAAFILLIGAAGWLTIKSDFDSKLDAQRDMNERMLAKMEELQKQREAPVAAPAPAPPPVEDPATPPQTAVATAPSGKSPAIRKTGTAPDEFSPGQLDIERELLQEAAGAKTGGAEPPILEEVEAAAAPKLNATQRRILDQPAIARVLEYSTELGAVVLDRGSKVQLQTGDEFALRRRTAIIGKLRISETIQPDQCVADVIQDSMPPGMVPMAGDEVILFTP